LDEEDPAHGATPADRQLLADLVQEPHLAAESGNYTALNERATEFEQGGVFDELVIVFDPDPGESGPPFNQQKCELPALRTDGPSQLISSRMRKNSVHAMS